MFCGSPCIYLVFLFCWFVNVCNQWTSNYYRTDMDYFFHKEVLKLEYISKIIIKVRTRKINLKTLDSSWMNMRHRNCAVQTDQIHIISANNSCDIECTLPPPLVSTRPGFLCSVQISLHARHKIRYCHLSFNYKNDSKKL